MEPSTSSTAANVSVSFPPLIQGVVLKGTIDDLTYKQLMEVYNTANLRATLRSSRVTIETMMSSLIKAIDAYISYLHAPEDDQECIAIADSSDTVMSSKSFVTNIMYEIDWFFFNILYLFQTMVQYWYYIMIILLILIFKINQ